MDKSRPVPVAQAGPGPRALASLRIPPVLRRALFYQIIVSCQEILRPLLPARMGRLSNPSVSGWDSPGALEATRASPRGSPKHHGVQLSLLQIVPSAAAASKSGSDCSPMAMKTGCRRSSNSRVRRVFDTQPTESLHGRRIRRRTGWPRRSPGTGLGHRVS